MATLEEAYKENDLDKFFKLNTTNIAHEFKELFEGVTDLPKFEQSLWLKPCLMTKYGLKRENIRILGSLIDNAGYCLQDITTNIYYVVNPYKCESTTGDYMCNYLLHKDIIKSESDVQAYKSGLISAYSLNENDITFLGLTYNNQYCFLDTVTKRYYTVSIDVTANYLFGNQDPKYKNSYYKFSKDPETMLFLEN